jgi:hypothetical protein
VSTLPLTNNVYGYLCSKVGLQAVANVLKSQIGWSANQIRVYRSHLYNEETLFIATATCEFETESFDGGDKWLFNGSVIGDIETIKIALKEICDPLLRQGFETKFEIYDEQFEFLSCYP